MTVNKTIKRPVLRYHGGKFILAPWIISNFPEHRIYVEPFGGGGSVLMRKERSYAEVYNDLWGIVVNVYQVLRNTAQATELKRVLELTPYSRTEFNNCGDAELSEITDPIERARRTILRSFAGFGSAATNAKYSTGFRANSNRSGTTPAHDWKNYSTHIDFFTDRLQGVVIENKDYKSVIQQHDTVSTLFYLDPPYLHSTRNMKRGNAAYAMEMTDEDHVEMAKHLHQIKGMCLVSGYENELYNELFKDWQVVKREALADGARKRMECLWINPHAQMKNTLKDLY